MGQVSLAQQALTAGLVDQIGAVAGGQLQTLLAPPLGDLGMVA
jgi:hypothetical protein